MQGLPLLAARWHVWWPPNLATYTTIQRLRPRLWKRHGARTRRRLSHQTFRAMADLGRFMGCSGEKLFGNLPCCCPAPCPRSDAIHRRMTAAGVVLLCTLFSTPGNCAAAALDTSSKLHAVRFQRFLQLHPGLTACILAAPALLERSWKAGLLP